MYIDIDMLSFCVFNFHIWVNLVFIDHNISQYSILHTSAAITGYALFRSFSVLFCSVNTIGITGFVLKTQYNINKSSLEKKIDDAYKKYLTLVDLLKNR